MTSVMDVPADIAPGRLSPREYEVNFDDATPPLNRKQALIEAARCYFCYDAPCIEACPTGIDIPRFIRKIATGNVKGAAVTILGSQHHGRHVRPRLPDRDPVRGGLRARRPRRQAGEDRPAAALRHRLAVRPGDPAFHARRADGAEASPWSAPGRRGLPAPIALALHGHEVTVFESAPKAGGLNEYGIAAYKMPDDFAQREVDFILSVGGIDGRIRQGARPRHHACTAAGGLRRRLPRHWARAVNALRIEGEDLAGVERRGRLHRRAAPGGG